MLKRSARFVNSPEVVTLREAVSERYCRERGGRGKKITEWAGQVVLLVRRWCPERKIIAVADGTYAAFELLDRCRSLANPITFITRLRLDAARYDPAPPHFPARCAAFAQRVSVCLTSRSSLKMLPPTGRGSWSRTVTAEQNARWRSFRIPPSGTQRACPLWLCVGY